MVAVKGKGTQIESILGKLLWQAGVRYRKNSKSVFGHPNFSHKGKKIAIFCDGEMWHGKDWDKQQTERIRYINNNKNRYGNCTWSI